ncbi:MAG TPA: kelch repeat-containing protein, partial [Polyangia bacterium]
MTGGRFLHRASQLNTGSNPTTSGKVLISGGINGTTSLNTAQLYNPTAGTWAAAANLNAARHAHTATLLADGKVLVAGGLNGTTTLATAAIYNPASGSGAWTATTGPLPPPGLKAHTATLLQTTNAQLNNKVLLVGGNSGSATVSTVFLFDPAQSTFSTLTALSSAREQHTAVTLANGKILVAGGKSGSTVLATAIAFDPSSGPGSWSAAGTMTSARVGHSMTLLPAGIVESGQVLIAGGSSTGSNTVSSAELFSGTTTWTATTSLPAPSQGHTAVVLGNNMVLAAGGLNGTTVLNAASLYDASNGLGCTSGSQCASGFCVNGVCCDTACDGGCGVCNTTGFVGTCRPIASGTTCRTSAGVCDVAEACNGSSVSCPANAFAPATTVCRTASGECDQTETCTGSSAACPADVLKANGTACADDGNVCTTDKCNGTAATCQHAAGNAGTICRAAAPGGCDVAEACTGSSASCPANTFAPPSTVCRPAAPGGCDLAETCTGSSAACPADAFASSSTVCRPAAGDCDLPATCTGSTASCSANLFKPSSTVCRPAAPGGCDVADNCTGASAACPADAFASNGTPCSDGDGCTQSDSCQNGTCTGANPVVCVAQNECHGVGTCSQSSGACSDPTLPDGTPC